MKIAVLKGGLSSEREVSLASGAAVAKALSELGHHVIEIDVDRDISTKLTQIKPDIAFNALHGTYGEDGCVQGVCEFLQIPYTHSGVTAAAIAMDKPLAKIIFTSCGIQCSEGAVFTRTEILKHDVIARPYIIKPTNDGSSVGILIVKNDCDINDKNVPQFDNLLVEKFIEGRELTVAFIDGKASDVCEIKPKDGFYDYQNKYTPGMTDYIIPADVPGDITKKARRWTKKAHNILGCKGVSRSDFRYGEDGELYMLEINTNPGMTATSLVPKLAKNMGLGFNDVVKILIDAAQIHHDQQ